MTSRCCARPRRPPFPRPSPWRARRRASRCRRSAGPPSRSSARPRRRSTRCAPESKPATDATIPPGTYRTYVTRADAKEHGFPWSFVIEEDPDPKALRTKTREKRLEFTEQGTFLVYDVWLDGTASIGWEGTYSIYRDRITVQGNEGTKITARVKVDGETLRFTDVQPGPKTPEAMTWGAKPFVKID